MFSPVYLRRSSALLFLAALCGCSPGQLTSFGSEHEPIELIDGGMRQDGARPFDGGRALDGGMVDGSIGSPDTFVPPMDAGPDVPSNALAAVRIDDVDGFQTLQTVMVRAGTAQTGGASIVAGRALWMRVTVLPESGFSGQVEGRLVLERGGESTTLTAERLVNAPIGAFPAEGFVFEVPAAWVGSNVSYSIGMYVPSGMGTGGDAATFPTTGSQSLNAQDMPAVEVRLVPVRYNADGSGRLPAIDNATIARMRAHFEALLPTGELRLSVTEPLDYNSPIGRISGGAWSAALSAIQQKRAADSPASHVYYIGLVVPAESPRAYCSGGCIAGIGSVNTRNRPSARSSIALGYGREDDFFSAFHELGHTFGLPHAPCGPVSGADPGYPHPGGRVGIWGRDERSGALHRPDQSIDFMAYCDPKWMSDYNYQNMANRVIAAGDGSFTYVEPHYQYTLSNFLTPQFDGIVDEAPADETTGQLLIARDEHGQVLGEIYAHEIPLSIPGFTQWFIPVSAGAHSVEFPDGRRLIL